MQTRKPPPGGFLPPALRCSGFLPPALRCSGFLPPALRCSGFLPPTALRCRGFTLVELVVVMLLVAIVATIGAARFADRQPFAVQSAADLIVSGLRIAQASAIAQRRTVHVVLAASPLALSVCLDAACTQPIAPPGGDGTWLQDSDGVQLAAATTFSFAPSGTPSIASNLAISVQSANGGTTPRTVAVEAVTGHVRLQ